MSFNDQTIYRYKHQDRPKNTRTHEHNIEYRSPFPSVQVSKVESASFLLHTVQLIHLPITIYELTFSSRKYLKRLIVNTTIIMNSDEASSLSSRLIERARQQRLDDQRRMYLRRAVQNAANDSSIAAVLLADRRRQALLQHEAYPSSSTNRELLARSIANPFTGGYLSNSSPRPSTLSTLNPSLNQLRLATSLAAHLGAPSNTIRGGLGDPTSAAPSAAALAGLSIHPNTALSQYPALDKLQLSRNSERLKRNRHEDLLSRTRETMVRKPGKKAKLLHREDNFQEEKESSRPSAPSIKKKEKLVQPRKHEFLLPPTGDYRQRSTGVTLLSYRALWDRMGGSNRKERFQRRVQNGEVPLIRKS